MAASRPELDRRGLEALHERLERSLFNVVFRQCWEVDESREIVQETFLRLWRMRSRVDPARVEALAYRIALNLASNRRRSRRIWRMVTLEAVRDRPRSEPSADAEALVAERRAAVREAIEALPEELGRVVVLCEFSELTYQQVGEVLGIPAGTVGSRRHAALRRLRERLADFAPEEGGPHEPA